MDFLPPEHHDGNIEYKLKLLYVDDEKFQNRVTQMKYRIDEGTGDAFYHIGVMDDGTILGISNEDFIESKKILSKMAQQLDACVQIVIEKQIAENRHYGEFLVRENSNGNYIDLKIGVVGNVDSGKSSTIAAITRGILDDGRGKARLSVFNHKHEIETGRTSSIGHQIVGFDKEGQIVNWKKNTRSSWSDIVQNSTKLINFFDMAGHEKYLKTTIYGLSAMHPDYCFVMVGGNMGLTGMTREHIGLCLSLKIPFIIIVTKVDIAPEHILKENLIKINKMCRNGAKKVPYSIKSIEDVLNAIKNIKTDSIVPILQISNVTRFNYNLIHCLLNYLPVRTDYSKFADLPAKLQIDTVFSVPGHGTIVCGILTEGTIKPNDMVYIGPFSTGLYRQIRVKNIHSNYREIKQGKTGIYIALSLKNITRKEIRKGMVITANKDACIAVHEFWAMMTILQSHTTTIRVGYEPVVHIHNIRQAVKIKEIVKVNDNNNDVLRTGDRAKVRLEFSIRPEFIEPNLQLIFREGRVKAVGKVLEII